MKDRFDASTPLVIDLAKSLINLMQQVDPAWEEAWLRVAIGDLVSESKGSYSKTGTVTILDVMAHKEFFHPTMQRGKELLLAMNRSSGLFLVTVYSNFEYKIDFEYENFNRWKISKLGGGSGKPEGL